MPAENTKKLSRKVREPAPLDSGRPVEIFAGYPMNTFETSREVPAPVEQVFAAISNPARLARWWGPAGFTNTFATCEFKTGGRWSFTMHGPNGANYPNESVSTEIA